MTTQLIKALLNGQAYDHETHDIHIQETHISWVICTGNFAYKIKKPVDLGFLDFSTLNKRHFFCLEELRLNQALAPELYLDVVAITGTMEAPHMEGQGAAIEYAVKLRQFDPACQFDRLLAAGKLEQRYIDEVTTTIVAFHDRARRRAHSDDAAVMAIHAPVRENYLQADRHELETKQRQCLQTLRQWHEDRFAELRPLIEKRIAGGFVRECHGDLHLGNIVVYHDRVMLFDRLEFDEDLRFIDVISEIAFLLMDLEANSEHGLAYRFLSNWLQHSGDYDGLNLLNYYKVYRAMVRAKVALIQGNPADFSRYLSLSATYAGERTRGLLLTHGLSGSGKSTITRSLAPAIEALIVRSDVERKRRLSGVYADLYSSAATRQTYALLADAAQAIISAGYDAIIDATFLKQNQRQTFIDLARRLDCPYLILDFQAPRELLEQWIRERLQDGHDVSDATLTVLEQQIETQQPLTTAEQRHVLTIDTSRDVDIATLAKAIVSRIR